jgi:phage gp36-like protein
MPYSTQADVQNAVGGAERLTQLTDYARTGNIDPAVVSAAIAQADARIDSYNNMRWDPAAPPVVIAGLSARMAARILRAQRDQSTEADLVFEKSDVAWLEALRDGTVTLPAGTRASTLLVDKAAPRESTKELSRERLKGYW